MVGEGVSPETTLAILLGASEFPRSPNLEAISAFAASSADLRAYLLDENGFNLPRENLLDLFDNEEPPSEILEGISRFLTTRQASLAERGGARDLILYYTGHGGFTPAREYFLAVRVTRHRMESGTSLRMSDLAATIKENGRKLRRYLILDCCFSAAAFKEFQSAPLTAARIQTIESLPKEGTTLLCSSNARTVSIAPEGAQHTMFSGALLHVLRSGTPKIETPLSMEQIAAEVKETIRERYPDDAVRPEILSPDQRVEDIALVPFFPNAATRPKHMKDQIEALSVQMDRLNSEHSVLVQRLTALQADLDPLKSLRSRIDALESSARPDQVMNGGVEREWERERRILELAPPEVLQTVHHFRAARMAGMIWAVIVLTSVILSIWSIFRGSPLGTIVPYRYDPVHWFPIVSFVLVMLQNARRIIGSGYYREAASARNVSAPWESLAVVLAAERASKLSRRFCYDGCGA